MVLAIESSATAASAAVVGDDGILAYTFQRNGLTHSRTLLPMVQQMLAQSSISLEDIEAVAVATGPGSFTGLRIGISTAKGLAWSRGIPCIAVSTLEAMAFQAAHIDGRICAVMDARAGQVYNAVFLSESGGLRRLTEDRAVSVEHLEDEIKNSGQTHFLVGDGARLCYNRFVSREFVKLAPEHLIFQSAAGVAMASVNGKRVGASELDACYIRLPQAERERLSRLSADKIKTE